MSKPAAAPKHAGGADSVSVREVAEAMDSRNGFMLEAVLKKNLACPRCGRNFMVADGTALAQTATGAAIGLVCPHCQNCIHATQ